VTLENGVNVNLIEKNIESYYKNGDSIESKTNVGTKMNQRSKYRNKIAN